MKKSKVKAIPVASLRINEGQLDWLPKNPLAVLATKEAAEATKEAGKRPAKPLTVKASAKTNKARKTGKK